MRTCSALATFHGTIHDASLCRRPYALHKDSDVKTLICSTGKVGMLIAAKRLCSGRTRRRPRYAVAFSSLLPVPAAGASGLRWAATLTRIDGDGLA
ncbi:hypothetical protein GUJ93_ZPchr0007g6393 [Zizania palustris]|uniref:Uncharacterized protein n=1 Tax=Zizania palustris TaxID=103762 RepID=A0A8J5W6E1_ZIZPA|nr:hypothetical protein GUJ93_ZPchr0007g6393 [Zizania palustris]